MNADTLAETQDFTIQVRQRGQITIPKKVREALSISEGDILTLVQVDEVFLLIPKKLKGAEITDRFTALMEAQGLTLNDLLEDLPQIRKELYEERWN
jgi:AbrB family looped-hinge helix DNA binding protein